MRAASGLVALLATTAFGAEIGKQWSVGWVNDVNPDGKFPRRAIGINGKFPADPLSVNSDDFVHINFTNKFGDGRPSALHGHGLFFTNVNYYDGAASVTQCPVPDGYSFYHEILNSPKSGENAPKQWGTYWLHGHYKGQYIDGLRTPFIIHRSEGEVYEYDDDYTVVLADWYHHVHGYILHHDYFVKGGGYPTPDSGLMYFAHTKKGEEARTMPGMNENATLPFEPGKTYRLRLINMSAASVFDFWIDGHDMDIIEVDGVDVERYPIDSVQVAIGQRYSVLVKARNETDKNWMIHANMERGTFSKVGDLKLNLTSTVSYGGKGVKMGNEDQASKKGIRPMDDTLFVPKEVIKTVEPDTRVTLVATVGSKNRMPFAAFNETAFVPPRRPAMLTMMSKNGSDVSVYGDKTNAVIAPYNHMVEVTILNDSHDVHPFHMHGTRFQVVHRANGTKGQTPKVPDVKEQKNPIRRDTVAVDAWGSVTIRFRANNPGAWIMHCHMDWHLSAGLAMVMLQAPEEAHKVLNVPPYLKEQCKMF